MTLQEHYTAIKNGKGNKAQFLKQAKNLFPEYFNQYTDFDTATNVLKSKQIISEAAGGVVSKGFDIWDWKKILAEEVKATEKETSKEVKDKQAHAYDNADMKNADNVNFNEIMKGFYAELRDEKNNGKTGDEVKAMVVKNLAKDPLYYTKNGMFGEKGVGYTDEAPGLGTNTQPTSKNASVLGARDEVNSDSDIVKNSLVGSTKKNVQDSLSNSEAKTSMPKKVKEMPDKGVTGVEKKVRLKEEEIKWERNSINENIDPDLIAALVSLGGATSVTKDVKDKLKAAAKGGKAELIKVVNQIKGKKETTESLEEQKLRSLIQQIIKEELNEFTDNEFIGGGERDPDVMIKTIVNKHPQYSKEDLEKYSLEKLNALFDKLIVNK